MAKANRKTDIHVQVYPRDAGDFGLVRMSGIERCEADEMRLAEQIRDSIRRHVDDVGFCEVRYTSQQYCTHCGAIWTEKPGESNQCCDKEVAEASERGDIIA